jgi:hypothetical protein
VAGRARSHADLDGHCAERRDRCDREPAATHEVALGGVRSGGGHEADSISDRCWLRRIRQGEGSHVLGHETTLARIELVVVDGPSTMERQRQQVWLTPT